jgi:hypothetical protein
MTLSIKHLKHVCLFDNIDESKVCRYLSNDELDEDKYYCQKLRANSRKKIDEEVLISSIRNQVTPQGDNCPGYPFLRNVIQGYDLD